MKIHRTAVVLGLAGVAFACCAQAQTTEDKVQTADKVVLDSLDAGSPAGLPGGRAGGQQGGFFSNWFAMVGETQSEQPHWMTPLATTTPRLEQEFRYDVQTQPHNSGLVTNNFGVSKGLEIIPARRWEVILAVPPYIENNPDSPHDGFGDWQFLVKYRIAAANEESGNYILTAFFQMTVPTGQYQEGNPSPVITPTIAYGKGFGARSEPADGKHTEDRAHDSVEQHVSVSPVQETVAGTGNELHALLRGFAWWKYVGVFDAGDRAWEIPAVAPAGVFDRRRV